MKAPVYRYHFPGCAVSATSLAEDLGFSELAASLQSCRPAEWRETAAATDAKDAGGTRAAVASRDSAVEKCGGSGERAG